MIEVSGLTKLYGERKVLHGISFSVGVGRVCGLLGPNGSGKSTTMDILSGLLGPSDGSVKVCGLDVVTQPQEVKAKVGYLPDNPPLHLEMKVSDFISYVSKIRGVPKSKQKSYVEKVIEDCDVKDVAHRIIGNLSKGYRQRVALCSALVHQPSVLILDEPTEGLDPNQILLIRNLIKKLSQDRTVIMSSHILSEVQATCEDVIIINQGHIAATTSLSLDAKPAYCLSIVGDVTSALGWVKSQSYITEATVHEDKVHFTFKDEDQKNLKSHLVELNKKAIESGISVYGLEEHKTGLESLFFDVIKKQPVIGGQE
jgi:ABC-2 type transport system ATP-binding protein